MTVFRINKLIRENLQIMLHKIASAEGISKKEWYRKISVKINAKDTYRNDEREKEKLVQEF